MPLETYVGCKIIKAEPMDYRSFQQSRNSPEWEQYQSLPGYRVIYEDGYTSWSPQDIFERSYRKLSPGEIAMVTQSNTL
jgi:hypothetical protein